MEINVLVSSFFYQLTAPCLRNLLAIQHFINSFTLLFMTKMMSRNNIKKFEYFPYIYQKLEKLFFKKHNSCYILMK